MEKRLKLVGLFFVLFSFCLVARLFYWQVAKAGELSKKARYQHQSGQEIIAPRGNILSHDGAYLVASTQSWLVFASTVEMTEDIKTVSLKLAPYFVEDKEDKSALFDEAERLEGLMQRKSMWVPLMHKVKPAIKKEIEKLDIGGIAFEKEEARVYPESSSSAHLLGFIGKNEEGEDKGYFGLEGFYDQGLSGKHGFLEREADARGAPIILGDSKEIAAVGGANLLTHIDKTIQLTVERKLKEGIEKYGAKSGNAVVMNPKTGGIIAMAAFPSYDPLKYFDFGNDLFKNPVISDSFEPGSIFKPLVMASGLDAGVITPDTVCDVCSGPVKVDKYSIETWDNKYYANSTMTEVLKHSDNVGMTFVGGRLGADKLYDYLDKFGIGRATGIDLQGEANPGIRKKGSWNIVDLATATFGQGIAVTPIQMIKAISVIANRGVSVTPQVVDKMQRDDWEQDIKPIIGERVISEKAAGEITAMMVEAVKNGEAKWAVPKGFRVAGKTGTAQIPVSGHYEEDKTIASFVGFAPPDDPQFVMLITLNEPQSSPWASETTAPLWFSIAKEMFSYLGIQPEN